MTSVFLHKSIYAGKQLESYHLDFQSCSTDFEGEGVSGDVSIPSRQELPKTRKKVCEIRRKWACIPCNRGSRFLCGLYLCLLSRFYTRFLTKSAAFISMLWEVFYEKIAHINEHVDKIYRILEESSSHVLSNSFDDLCEMSWERFLFIWQFSMFFFIKKKKFERKKVLFLMLSWLLC